MSPEQDERLAAGMRRAQAGDKAAYDALLKEISQLLRRFFGGRADCDETADDLVQETLLSVHQARHTFLEGRPFAPWMYAIARRRLADYWRKKARTVRSEELDETLDWADNRGDQPGGESGESRVRETLSGLPEGQRRVVELLKVEGLSIREVSKKLDMSETAVKVTAHRAYERLRKALRNGQLGNE